MAHSFIGGSTAARILACPGSLTLHRKLLDPSAKDEASEYAREGSMLHTIMEEALHSREFDKYLGTDPGGFGVVCTQEMIDSKVIPACLAFDEYVSTLDDALIFEQEIVVSAPSIHKTAFGTADILGRSGRKLVVGDWKFGDGVRVDVEDNEQMLFYAACALETADVRDLTEGVEEVDLLIIQPMREQGEVWDVHTVSIDAVREFAARMKLAVDVADMPQPTMALGDHCRWCKVKLHCDLQRGGLAELAHAVRIDDLGELLRRAEIAENFIKDIRAEAHSRLEAGQPVDGWKLVAKRAQRKWVDAEMALKALTTAGKLKKKDVLVSEVISPAQAEKLLKKNGHLNVLDPLVTSVSSGTTIAPLDDPRPMALNKSAFAAIAKRV